MELTVAKILKATEVQGKFSMQTRTAFTANETGEKILSVFSKFPLKVGQTITGEIKEVEKDGKTYHNFEFTKKSQGISDADKAALKQSQEGIWRVETKLDLLTRRLEEAGVIKKPESMVRDTGVKYPIPGVDDVDPEDMPW